MAKQPNKYYVRNPEDLYTLEEISEGVADGCGADVGDQIYEVVVLGKFEIKGGAVSLKKVCNDK